MLVHEYLDQVIAARPYKYSTKQTLVKDINRMGGSGSSYSVTSSWKPSYRGAISLTAAATPTGAGISSATSNPVSIIVGKRVGARY